MVKIFVVYDTKYGNTKIVAEKIIEGIKKVQGVDAAIADVKEVNYEEIAKSDAVLMGSPNHVGKPARDIDAFVDNLSKLKLNTKWASVFDTHMAADERAHAQMEKRISEKVPALRLITPGLSIKVKSGLSMKGPIEEGELPKCVDFGEKIATQVKNIQL